MYRKNRTGILSVLLRSKKALALALALIVSLSVAVSSTLAWLIDETKPVTNTFTYGDIDIELTETDSDEDGDENNNTYEMMPGKTISKDPKVTVYADSKDSWLFVAVEESANFDDFLEYTIADGWTEFKAEGNTVIYYREVNESDQDQVFSILKDDQVKVKGSVTKEMLNALDAEGASNYPTLTFKAVAMQRDAEIPAIATVEEAFNTMTTSSTAPIL